MIELRHFLVELAIDVKEDLDLKPMAVRVVVNPPPPKSADKTP